MKPVQLTMDMILKMKPEEFRDTIKSQNRGFNESLKKLLALQYDQVTRLKEGLVLLKEKDNFPNNEEREKCNKSLEELYICLQLIEDRHNIINEYLKSLDGVSSIEN